MFAHYRPNEFLQLKFDSKELMFGYEFLKTLYTKTPTQDLAKMIKVMENNLFPKPKFMLISNIHICEKCFCELDVRNDAYHVRTDENGIITWTHQVCPELKKDRP